MSGFSSKPSLRWVVCIAIVVALSGTQDALSEEITKDDLVSILKAQREVLDAGGHVAYHVDQVPLTEDEPFDSVQFGCEDLEPNFGRYWRAEHAWSGDKRFGQTSRFQDFADDPYLTIRMNDGKRSYKVTREKREDEELMVYQGVGLDKYSAHALPEEELYKEIIGQESLRQDVGPTFRGYKNPLPYDVLEVLADERSRVRYDDSQSLVVVELLDLDSIWLDPEYGYAIVRRERKWTDGGPLRVTMKNSRFQDMGEGLWLPLESVIEYYSNPEFFTHQRTVDATLTVDSLTLSPPADLFDPIVKAGTRVVDLEHDYVGPMPPLDGQALDEYLDDPSVGGRLLKTDFSYTRTIIIFLSLVVVGAGITRVVLKRRKQES